MKFYINNHKTSLLVFFFFNLLALPHLGTMILLMLEKGYSILPKLLVNDKVIASRTKGN